MSKRQTFKTNKQNKHFHNLTLLVHYLKYGEDTYGNGFYGKTIRGSKQNFSVSLSFAHHYDLKVAGGTKQALASASLYVTSNLAVLGTLMQATLEGIANIVTTSQLLSSGNVQEAIWDAEAALVGESSINIL